ncbi:flagelliform silk protein [hydrocarbon metagenome]|uniref:Flagelliform silk protein n=1 Tax=hydrocarbon metagenome TaxID=938273 RepID=A0A0W8E9N3_9ZZZZ
MRRIIYLRPAAQDLAEEVLDECSLYTPLVEPQEDGSLFCDFSGCGPILDILRAIVKRNYHLTGQRARVSLASSRVVAENALKRSGLPNEKLYLGIKRREAEFIEVLPGKEEEFMASIPLEEFTAITAQDSKKLKRAGFSKVGELKVVPVSRLVSLLGEKGMSLSRQCQGIDDRPVLGLYPPLQIYYPLVFSEGSFNRVFTDIQIREACQVLQTLLEKRNCGCRIVGLEIKTAGQTMIKNENRLKNKGYKADFLAAVIIGMLDKMKFNHIPEEGTIILAEISSLDWEEQDLFSFFPCERNDSSLRVEKVMEKLDSRFPGRLLLGQEEARREKILAYFDPWRINE